MDLPIIEWYEMLLRLGFATAMGFVIGFERERHNQPAGLRTHIIVCVGSALMMIVSYDLGRLGHNTDPTRIAAQVVSGIGFLGAGAILRFGTSIRGLTTAACLWTIAGVGLAAGAGLYLPAAAATLIVFFTITLFDKLEKIIVTGKYIKRVIVVAKDKTGIIGRVEDVLQKFNIEIKQIGINMILVDNKVQVSAVVKIPDNINMDALDKAVSAIDGVEQFEVD
ncbi:MAG: MgtC/SapB family protein [Planctomycetes bacterium]|nr:MgtC/SapB family protein [Planctomycetota bacterium]